MQWCFKVIHDFVIISICFKKKTKQGKVLKGFEMLNSLNFPSITDDKEGSFVLLIRFLKEGKGLSVVPVSIISLKGLI